MTDLSDEVCKDEVEAQEEPVKTTQEETKDPDRSEFMALWRRSREEREQRAENDYKFNMSTETDENPPTTDANGRTNEAHQSPQTHENNHVVQSGGTRPACMPQFRDVNEIFEDDENRRVHVQELYDTDGGVLVENGPDSVTVYHEWSTAKFAPQIIDNIKRSGYDRPRNFQRYAMPLIMHGLDLKGQAETGSGKSAAFLLPIIHKLSLEFAGKSRVDRHREVAALVIVPTRELAVQIMEQGKKFADGTSVSVNCAYGEYKVSTNKESIHLNGCDVLVGTIGRLRSFIEENFVKVHKLQFLVLDEADVLLNEDFLSDIDAILHVEGFPSIEKRQTLFFSATFKPEIRQLANKFCKKNSALIRNKCYDANKRISQEVVEVPVGERTQFLLDQLKSEIEQNKGELPKTLIFVDTKRDADALAEDLKKLEISVQAVHGERTQQQREELNRAFRDGKLRALVVTDLFSRGLDIMDLGHVINVHMPQDRNTYVNRIGRTGRSEVGRATTYFDPNHNADREMAKIIQEEMNKTKQPVPDFLRQVVADLNNHESS